MEKIGRILRSCICALGIGLMLNPSGLQAVVTWVGGVTPDVLDQDLIIDASGGNVVLQGLDDCNSTLILANAVDVNVTITGGNAVVTGNGNGQTILRLVAAAGHTITFDLTGLDSLTFEGSTDLALSPLLISAEGPGTVTFNIRGGNSLTLTNNPTLNGSTLFYLILRTGATPTLQFIRDDLGNPTFEADTASIIIGAGSLLSYASLDAGLINQSTGTMLFDPTNVGDGRFVLQVNDTGAFTMAVHQAVFNSGFSRICAVNRNIPAAGTAITTIVNTGGATDDAGLMINNYNATYADYLIDPYADLGAAADPVFYSGNFDGLRYGVTAGANHTLIIGANAYLDYVGLANNICPTPASLPCIIPPTQTLACPCEPNSTQFLKLRNYSAFTIDGWYNPNAVASTIALGVQSGMYFRSGVNAEGVVVNNDPSSQGAFTINPTEPDTSIQITPGAGEYVFDVEAHLIVQGSNINTNGTLNSRIELLSLEVAPHSGPLFPVEGNPLNTQFLARTFTPDINDQLNQYNKAAWLVNDRVDLFNTALAHMDANHLVCQNNDVISEPTYVGGEKWWLSFLRFEQPDSDDPDVDDNGCQFNYCITPPCPLVPRPSINFYDSILQVQYSLGATGLDFQVPTYLNPSPTAVNNLSDFTFYSNGYLVDNGTGRQMILGTLIGSQACDGCTIISDDAHLNIMQDQNSNDALPVITQILQLLVATNNAAVNNQIVDPITNQTSIEVIYLGHNSNISIGNQPVDASNDPCDTGFAFKTCDELLIAGDFFNISTRGGSLGIPSTSDVTGQGGIFVDLNGLFSILPDFIASLDVMVTLYQNCPNVTASCTDTLTISDGMINLPTPQIFFSDQVGIAAWQKDLVVNPVIVPTGSHYGDYTLDWLSVTKSSSFMPYLISNINVCNCPTFILANETDIPVVQGEVDQLQIAGSRIGDPVHLAIIGGWVREILWLSECKAGEAPTAVIVMSENGRLGLNNAHRNPDSLFTQTVLGANGINIVADGNARIDLNDDVIINNICSIIQGPNFVVGNVIEFLADTPYTIRVTKEGILDLSNFTVAGTIRFGGNVRLSFEPGAQLILGAATLEFSDNATVEVESSYDLQGRIAALDTFWGAVDNTVNPLVSVAYTSPNNQYSPLTGYGVGVQNTDPYRVRIVGGGNILGGSQIVFTDNSSMLINTNGILGIESDVLLPSGIICTGSTDVTLQITGAAQVNVGKDNTVLGGAFQVGNTVDRGQNVNFTLTLAGPDAQFNIGSGGFFGLGAGVARPNQGVSDNLPLPSVPVQPLNQSRVLADTLFNVVSVTMNFSDGKFSHNRIFVSDDVRAASMVLGNVGTITVDFNVIGDIDQLNDANFLTSGGGNFFLLNPGSVPGANLGALRMIDRTQDNIINAPFGSTTVALTRLFDGILASTELQADATVITDVPSGIFQDLKTGDATATFGPARDMGDVSPIDPQRFRNERTFAALGYVDRAMIGRTTFQDILDTQGGTGGERRERAYDLGAAIIQVDTTQPAPAPVLQVQQIQSA